MSSFLEPNYDYLKLFHGFKKWAEIIEKKQIKTKKLDDLNLNIDVLKIDVQGFESKIIEFGKNTIKNSLVVQIEISPTPIYKKEKSFSFVSQQLEKLGYRLHMFNHINSRAFKPMIINNNIYAGLNHLFQLDCVFIKKCKPPIMFWTVTFDSDIRWGSNFAELLTYTTLIEFR